MGVGSVAGAILGGMMVGIAPQSILKILPGIILNISAFRIFRGAKRFVQRKHRFNLLERKARFLSAKKAMHTLPNVGGRVAIARCNARRKGQ